MEIAIIAALLIKHYVCDFLIQPAYMIQDKACYGASGGIHHAGLHSFGTWVVVFLFTDAFTATIFALADGLAHYHIDWIKTKLTKNSQTHHWAYWAWFGLDQLAHALTYLVIVAIIVL
jgi:hypothetical protein